MPELSEIGLKTVSDGILSVCRLNVSITNTDYRERIAHVFK
ncbi:hypothetical protein [Neisseria meningitidis serogroup B]|uniref:Uncharacterized protein n=1 Tax=Neisseria meningitidis serogroup B TaxID=491 RepID=A0A0H5Q9G4_NEIMI|nr:hypothetical protein [Neisseria meningitidis serogroup B]